jgi:hypothetical protein
MTSLVSEVGLFTIPDPSIYGPKLDTVSAPNGVFTNLTVENATITTITISGPFNITGTTTTQINDPNLTAQTVGAATAQLYSYAMPLGTVNTAIITVSGITAGGNTLSIRGSIRAKNIGGIGSVGTTFDYYFNSDAALAGASMSFSAVGTNLIVSVSGVAAQTIRFSGFAMITRTVFS